MPSVSIIIPTLNEASCLERTLRHLRLLAPASGEILVVDGGSQDGTVAIAKQAGVQVLTGHTCGRSAQMNQGAEVAMGDILCFLHADTLVPDDLVTVIEQTLADPTIACGGFISLMAGTAGTQWGGVFAQLPQNLLCPPAVSAPPICEGTATAVWRSGDVLPSPGFLGLRWL